MPRNLEIKYRINSIDEAVRTAGAIGARDGGRLHQIDTYFNVSRGRLKLRRINSTDCQLIFYLRPEDSSVRVSSYEMFPLQDGDGLQRLLEASLGIIGRVEKNRRLYLFHETRIHIDSVAGLGDFLELETPVTLSPEESRSEVDFLMRSFCISDESCIPASYIDLKQKVAI